MSEARYIRLLRRGHSQIINIPAEFELPRDKVLMRRDGDRLVIEPLAKRGLPGLLASLEPLDEAFPEIADPPPSPERDL